MLSEHFSEQELRVDEAEQRIVDNARWLCESILEPIRAHYSKPLIVTSGYRAPKQNEATGGVANSFHLYEGSRCAADTEVKDVPITEYFDWLRLESKLPADKFILEYSLRGEPQIVHIQADPTLTRPRTAWIGKTHGQGRYMQVECL